MNVSENFRMNSHQLFRIFTGEFSTKNFPKGGQHIKTRILDERYNALKWRSKISVY